MRRTLPDRAGIGQNKPVRHRKPDGLIHRRFYIKPRLALHPFWSERDPYADPQSALEQFHPDLPVEAETICLWNKARRRDMASHGKEPQRSAAGKSPGIDGTVRVKLL
ncbi:hypothetical protein [Noviherbaspirillum saxi]|uniref:Uncharacterized protein n=1 Tax=Noviherbaspirillum saxi TaxID=2320863 RepID=A0A3A3FPY4_9BURK|nr:hypothetical protein [Noviherbaspirillum saxi]RJF95759.1 hypothetical protein D3871_20490 [Noviherbaspirillum saxi]